ncbi:ABC transporter permease [Loktanella sp. M215]|uniref:ABC transporter permease n=1 Tax=Loktanella sp. M215 TaxID=2675431 RepID=UPI001F26FF0B|nr:ABC transporter permease [Loktanella sp. M215]MCF7698305.1 ABC transporter permease subunit [Loktanella sp. M215]
MNRPATVSDSAPAAGVDPVNLSAPGVRAGRGPWATAVRRLSRNRSAVVSVIVLCIIVVLSALAPLYADLAGSDPFRSNLGGSITLNGTSVPVMQPSTTGLGLGVTPIGPTWTTAYMLGADNQGRDVAARLLYGGRNSLFIAGAATVICLTLASLIGVVAGFAGGVVDMVLSRILDVLWAFPVYLLAISLSIVLLNSSFAIGPFTITAGSLVLPIGIIGVIYVPYVARPIRSKVLTLRQSEFVLAAIGLGMPTRRILLRDILPNVVPTLIVFVPILLALAIVTESALSFLSIGVQPPDASWGTIIQDGQTLLYSRPVVALAPGIAIVITVLALNVLGDCMRDALDPRFKLG